jgi:hypothetical protein
MALYLLGQGHTVLGLSMIVVAKVVGTAITARLFMLTQPTLMRLPWFAHWFGRWLIWKGQVVAQVKASAAWKAIGQFRQGVRVAVQAMVQKIRAWLD